MTSGESNHRFCRAPYRHQNSLQFAVLGFLLRSRSKPLEDFIINIQATHLYDIYPPRHQLDLEEES